MEAAISVVVALGVAAQPWLADAQRLYAAGGLCAVAYHQPLLYGDGKRYGEGRSLGEPHISIVAPDDNMVGVERRCDRHYSWLVSGQLVVFVAIYAIPHRQQAYA